MARTHMATEKIMRRIMITSEMERNKNKTHDNDDTPAARRSRSPKPKPKHNGTARQRPRAPTKGPRNRPRPKAQFKAKRPGPNPGPSPGRPSADSGALPPHVALHCPWEAAPPAPPGRSVASLRSQPCALNETYVHEESESPARARAHPEKGVWFPPETYIIL